MHRIMRAAPLYLAKCITFPFDRLLNRSSKNILGKHLLGQIGENEYSEGLYFFIAGNWRSDADVYGSAPDHRPLRGDALPRESAAGGPLRRGGAARAPSAAAVFSFFAATL